MTESTEPGSASPSTEAVSPLSAAAPFAYDPATSVLHLDPSDPAFYQDPYAVFRALRRQTNVFFWAESGCWCVIDAESVAALLRDRRFGREILHVASREEVGLAEVPPRLRPFYDIDAHSMLEREPPVHTRLRTLVNRAFVSRAIERLRPRIAALAESLIDGFVGAGEVELITAFATPIPVIVIAELLGVPTDRAPQLLEWSHQMVAMYQVRRTRAVEDAAVSAAQEFSAFVRGYVAERRGRPADDLISHLIAAEEDGARLSEDELVTTCILLLNAGHEATVHAIGNAVSAILQAKARGLDPAGLFTTPAQTDATIEETLRYDPPLHLFKRYALEPVEVAGVKLAKGEQIGLMLGAANRDPARWEAPDRFDPSRPAAPHLAFGGGIHFCVGAPLARLELAVALPILFRRLPALRLVAEPRARDTYHFRGLQALHLTWG